MMLASPTARKSSCSSSTRVEELFPLQVAAVCAGASLEHLSLHERLWDGGSERLTVALIDGILAGRSAATLQKIALFNVAQGPDRPIRGADVLRLLRGCPKLSKLTWYVERSYQEDACVDRATHDAIVSLLFVRGGPGTKMTMGDPSGYGEDGYLWTGGLGAFVLCPG